MQVQTVDAVFIRASRSRIHAVVADAAGWGGWWPRLTVHAAGAGRSHVTLHAPGRWRRPQRWTLEVVKVRPDLGIHLRYTGHVAGEAEFYYLDERAGTVVAYALRGAVPDVRWRSTVRDHRAGVRAGLEALKRRLEGDRVPGAEPDAVLLREQRRARAAFDQRVVASQRTLAKQVVAGQDDG